MVHLLLVHRELIIRDIIIHKCLKDAIVHKCLKDAIVHKYMSVKFILQTYFRSSNSRSATIIDFYDSVTLIDKDATLT